MGIPRYVNAGSLGPTTEGWLRSHGRKIKPKLTPEMASQLDVMFEIVDADGSGEVFHLVVNDTKLDNNFGVFVSGPASLLSRWCDPNKPNNSGSTQSKTGTQLLTSLHTVLKLLCSFVYPSVPTLSSQLSAVAHVRYFRRVLGYFPIFSRNLDPHEI